MARSKRNSIIGIPPQDINDPNNSSGTSMIGVQNIQEHYKQAQAGRFDEVQEKYGSTFVKDGLQVWYDANIESSWVQNDLNVYDVSGNNRDAIWNAGMGTDTHTGAGSVVHNIWKISNNTRYLTGPAANAVGLDGDSFTLGMTIYVDAAAQSVAFHFNRDASYTDSTDRAISLHMVWSDGRIYFDTHGDGTAYNRHTGDTNDHTYDTWQTIFFTADSNGVDSMTKSIYIDGTLASSSTSSSLVTLTLGSLATEWFYGRTAYPSTAQPNWYSCVGLWNRALTSSEISTMHGLIDIS